MKQTIIAIFIIISVNSFGQTSTSGKVNVNTDSLQKVENNKLVLEIIKTTPVKELEEWLYKNWSAEKYNEFVQVYNVFIQQRFNQKKKN